MGYKSALVGYPAMNEPGLWIMLAFWVSAAGGVAAAVMWARSRRRNPVPRALLRRLLKERLERGEISRETYDQRLREIDQRDAR